MPQDTTDSTERMTKDFPVTCLSELVLTYYFSERTSSSILYTIKPFYPLNNIILAFGGD